MFIYPSLCNILESLQVTALVHPYAFVFLMPKPAILL